MDSLMNVAQASELAAPKIHKPSTLTLILNKVGASERSRKLNSSKLWNPIRWYESSDANLYKRSERKPIASEGKPTVEESSSLRAFPIQEDFFAQIPRFRGTAD